MAPDDEDRIRVQRKLKLAIAGVAIGTSSATSVASARSASGAAITTASVAAASAHGASIVGGEAGTETGLTGSTTVFIKGLLGLVAAGGIATAMGSSDDVQTTPVETAHVPAQVFAGERTRQQETTAISPALTTHTADVVEGVEPSAVTAAAIKHGTIEHGGAARSALPLHPHKPTPANDDTPSQDDETDPSTDAAEVTLLRTALGALRDRRYDAAANARERHAVLFPSSPLAVERAGIRALLNCETGDGPDAANRFIEQHPGSPLRARLTRACQVEE